MVIWLHGYMLKWLQGYMVTWLQGYNMLHDDMFEADIGIRSVRQEGAVTSWHDGSGSTVVVE